jgi:parallel beta-helix repeat protein
MPRQIEKTDYGGGEMSWAGKRAEIVSIAFLVILASMYGMLFPLNLNVAAGTEVSGHITADATWTANGSPYWIVGDTVVDYNVNLTIEAGVSVLFNGSYFFNVSGSLVTEGNSMSMVVFSSGHPTDPLANLWKGIVIDMRGDLHMDYTVVSYAICGVSIGSNDAGGQKGISILNSIITSNRDCGIAVRNYSQVYIYNSEIRTNGVGIDLGFSMGNTVDKTILSGNGIAIVGNYSYSYIQNSHIFNNSQGILYMGGWGTTTSYNWYWNNTIYNNVGQPPPGGIGGGIYLQSAMYDTIWCNLISYNGIGISLYNSHMVTVHHNDILYNTEQAVDDLANYFDDGSEGNFWSDYNGTDPNGDGIGDTPYYVDNNSVDNYPLMNRVGGCGIDNQDPVADADGPYFGKKGWVIDFDGTGSYDLDGSIVEYEWDVGDGSPKKYGATVNHTYSVAGIYNVTLMVTDNDGASDNDTTYAEIIDGYPNPPRLIDAVLTGSMNEDVELNWELSGDDGSGDDDVTGYNIYRGSSYNPDCVGYSLVATAPSGSASWTDALGGHGDVNTYFYCIGAVDDAAQETLDDQQASKFAKNMATGMVLMSVPVVTSDTLITTVFQTLDYVRVIYYDANSGKRHNWRTFDTRKPYSDVFDIDHTMAVWVEVTADGHFTTAGLVPQSTLIHLGVGWNFVGYPSFIDRTVSDTITVFYQTMETFDPMDPPWYLQRLADTDLMTAGEGYWIHVSEEFDWVLVN